MGQKREVERAKSWRCTWLSVCDRPHGSGWVWVLVHRGDGLREGMGGQARTCKWREKDGSEAHRGPAHSISTRVFTWLSVSTKLLSPTLVKSGELSEVYLYGEWGQQKTRDCCQCRHRDSLPQEGVVESGHQRTCWDPPLPLGFVVSEAHADLRRLALSTPPPILSSSVSLL